MSDAAVVPASSGAPDGPRNGNGNGTRDQHVPRSIVRRDDGTVVRDLGPVELGRAVERGDATVWVDVDSSNRHQLAVLDKVFHFHPLAIEDTLNPNSRVKIEEYDGYLFIIIRGVRFCEETEQDPYDTETYNTCFFLGPRYLVTVHGQPVPVIDEVADRIVRSPELLDRGTGRLMHAVMDGEVDAFFPIIDHVDEFLDGLEQRVFASFDEEVLRDIFQVKRLVLGLRRHLAPQREVFNVLTNRPTPLLPPETQVYFRDIYDHVLRINDSIDTYRDLLSGVLDSYLTQVSNRLGRITKGLSVVATVTLPFVVVSGMWGMNFDTIPLSHHAGGFWIMLAAQVGLGAALYAGLRWRGLL